MKKYNYLIILLLVINIFKAQQSKVYRNIYKPLDNKEDYPKVFNKIDKKLQEFYSTIYPYIISNNINAKDYFLNMDTTELKQWEMITLEFYNAPEKYTAFFQYKPFYEQMKRQSESTKHGVKFNEIRSPSPQGVFSLIKKIIIEKYPESELFFRARYMLVIKVDNIRKGGLSYDPKYPGFVITGTVINDIKGNYISNPIIELIIRNKNRKMKIGETYFVLIEGNDSGKGKVYEPFLLCWEGANGKSIFEVKNGYIFDPNEDLNFNRTYFTIKSYSSYVKNFYSKIIDDSS